MKLFEKAGNGAFSTCTYSAPFRTTEFETDINLADWISRLFCLHGRYLFSIALERKYNVGKYVFSIDLAKVSPASPEHKPELSRSASIRRLWIRNGRVGLCVRPPGRAFLVLLFEGSFLDTHLPELISGTSHTLTYASDAQHVPDSHSRKPVPAWVSKELDLDGNLGL